MPIIVGGDMKIVHKQEGNIISSKMLPDGTIEKLLISEGAAKDVPEELRYLFSQPFQPSAQCMANMLSLETLFQVLETNGYDTKLGVAICLEPECERLRKIAEGKINEIWSMFLYRHPVYNIPLMEIKREKGDLYRIFMCWNIPKQYCFPLAQEEPKNPGKAGHFIIKSYKGFLLTTIDIDSMGRRHPILFGGSLTRGGAVPAEAKLVGFYYTNYQRIYPDKPVLVYVEELKKSPIISNSHLEEPEEGWDEDNLPVGFIQLMHYEDLLKESHDARTLATVAMYLALFFGKDKRSLMETLAQLSAYNEMPLEETAKYAVLSKTEQVQFDKEMAFCRQNL
jgi:hypothetical protein